VTVPGALTETWQWYVDTTTSLVEARLALASTLRARHETRMAAYAVSRESSVAARNRDADTAAAGYEADIIDKQAEIAGLSDLTALLHDAVTAGIDVSSMAAASARE